MPPTPSPVLDSTAPASPILTSSKSPRPTRQTNLSHNNVHQSNPLDQHQYQNHCSGLSPTSKPLASPSSIYSPRAPISEALFSPSSIYSPRISLAPVAATTPKGSGSGSGTGPVHMAKLLPFLRAGNTPAPTPTMLQFLAVTAPSPVSMGAVSYTHLTLPTIYSV